MRGINMHDAIKQTPYFNFTDLLNDLGTYLHSKYRNPEIKNALACLCRITYEDVSTDCNNYFIH